MSYHYHAHNIEGMAKSKSSIGEGLSGKRGRKLSCVDVVWLQEVKTTKTKKATLKPNYVPNIIPHILFLTGPHATSSNSRGLVNVVLSFFQTPSLVLFWVFSFLD